MGPGKDIIDYSKEPEAAIILDLAAGDVTGGLFAKGDKVKNIENAIGTKFDDKLVGDDNNNYLNGL